MSHFKLESKIVVDRFNKKLGTIVRVDDVMAIDNEENTPFAIIKVHRLFNRESFFPMPLLETTEYQVLDDKIYLTITKKEFFRILKLYEKDRELKAKATKLAEIRDVDVALAKSFWGRY